MTSNVAIYKIQEKLAQWVPGVNIQSPDIERIRRMKIQSIMKLIEKIYDKEKALLEARQKHNKMENDMPFFDKDTYKGKRS